VVGFFIHRGFFKYPHNMLWSKYKKAATLATKIKVETTPITQVDVFLFLILGMGEIQNLV
jgi:hypothetical protein